MEISGWVITANYDGVKMWMANPCHDSQKDKHWCYWVDDVSQATIFFTEFAAWQESTRQGVLDGYKDVKIEFVTG